LGTKSGRIGRATAQKDETEKSREAEKGLSGKTKGKNGAVSGLEAVKVRKRTGDQRPEVNRLLWKRRVFYSREVARRGEPVSEKRSHLGVLGIGRRSPGICYKRGQKINDWI